MSGTGGVPPPPPPRNGEGNGAKPREVERSPSFELIEETPRGFAVRSAFILRDLGGGPMQ